MKHQPFYNNFDFKEICTNSFTGAAKGTEDKGVKIFITEHIRALCKLSRTLYDNPNKSPHNAYLPFELIDLKTDNGIDLFNKICNGSIADQLANCFITACCVIGRYSETNNFNWTNRNYYYPESSKNHKDAVKVRIQKVSNLLTVPYWLLLSDELNNMTIHIEILAMDMGINLKQFVKLRMEYNLITQKNQNKCQF